MQDTTAQTKPRATYRQWETVSYDCMDGAVIQVRRHTVALYRSKFTGEVMGLVNGNAVPLRDAVSILEGADTVTKVFEQFEEARAEVRTIGKAAAYELHKELGRLKFRDHYGTASEALERPVSSLAELTAEEANTVRSYARGSWGLPA